MKLSRNESCQLKHFDIAFERGLYSNATVLQQDDICVMEKINTICCDS